MADVTTVLADLQDLANMLSSYRKSWIRLFLLVDEAYPEMKDRPKHTSFPDVSDPADDVTKLLCDVTDGAVASRTLADLRHKKLRPRPRLSAGNSLTGICNKGGILGPLFSLPQVRICLSGFPITDPRGPGGTGGREGEIEGGGKGFRKDEGLGGGRVREVLREV
jgi:hypothetical protein